jgi:hypothetical protein
MSARYPRGICEPIKRRHDGDKVTMRRFDVSCLTMMIEGLGPLTPVGRNQARRRGVARRA